MFKSSDVRRKPSLRAWISVVLILSFAGISQTRAATVTLSGEEIRSFTQFSSTGDGPPDTDIQAYLIGGAAFRTGWSVTDTGVVAASVGLFGLDADWSPYDLFSLRVRNDDENRWFFRVYVADQDNDIIKSDIFSPESGETRSISIPLVGLDFDADRINGVFVAVGTTALPIAGFDRTAEWSVKAGSISPVPVPGAAWMFGSALGLLGWARARARAK